MPVSDFITGLATPTCPHNSPSVSGVGTSVPEQHPGVTTTLEHLESHKMPPSADMPSDLPIAPAMQAIIVNRVSIVEPQLAPIVGDDAEIIVA